MSSYPTIIDNLKTISISFIKSRKYLDSNGTKVGQLQWICGGKPQGEIDLLVTKSNDQALLILEYNFNKEPVKLHIKIISQKSNLGKGLVWYFICPVTQKKCRILYQVDKYFLHRDNLSNAMYSSQTKSKKYRDLEKEFACVKYRDQYRAFQKKYAKRYYNGKITKKYLAVLNKMGIKES